MLQYLHIKNLALLEEVDLEFDSGFTAVTGETGAGKSVLLGALSLLSGCRMDKGVIRQGTLEAEVEASIYFENPGRINNLLTSLNLPVCEENVLILKRCISREKSPRIQINGALATLSSLQAIGDVWIDFHGPGEPQKLFHEHYQLQMLDLYAGLAPLLKDYHDLYQSWKSLLDEARKISTADQLSEDEIHFYQSQINKINAINPTTTSIEALENSFAQSSHAQEIVQLASHIESTLTHENGVISGLQGLIKSATALSKILPSSLNLSERIHSLIVEVEDLASEFMHLAESTDSDPDLVEETHRQMNQWLEIQRQYGPTLEAVIKKRDALKEKIASQSNIEARLHELNLQASQKEEALSNLAGLIEKKRRVAAEQLGQQTQEMLKTLGFQKARLLINIHQEVELKAHGNCYCEFLFAPNSGQDLMSLNKIASSGEIARVMLALKTILAQSDQTPVLVFDEVDANVGGEIASTVARELKSLSKNHQVLCVTHLPQVAAQAHNHYLVTKAQSATTTLVNIIKLEDREERTKELARMLGDRSSMSAVNHAKELLKL